MALTPISMQQCNIIYPKLCAIINEFQQAPIYSNSLVTMYTHILFAYVLRTSLTVHVMPRPH